MVKGNRDSADRAWHTAISHDLYRRFFCATSVELV